MTSIFALVNEILPIFLVGVFVALALVHVYWGFGGHTAWIAALPEVEGRPAFTPSVAATFTVAGGLFGFAGLVAGTAGLVELPISRPAQSWLCFGLSAVFLLRAVGDFRLVGFFKKVRGTRFARMDSALYSPLCLAISAGVLAVAWGHRG